MESKLQPYGNFWSGDGLSNIPVGGKWGNEVGFWFSAQDTVPVNRLRFFNCWSKERGGYHAGTGGCLLIRLVQTTEDLENSVLAQTIVDRPASLAKQLFVIFDQTAVLKRWGSYAITFRNIHPDPENHWVSVNTMATFSRRPRAINAGGMEVLMNHAGDRTWVPFHPEYESVLPIFTLYYAASGQLPDGIAVPGYGGMESWVAEPRKIAGDEMVREVFKPIRDTVVENVAVRLAKIGRPGPLTARLTMGPGLLAEGSIDQKEIKPVDVTLMPPNRLGHDWVVIKFPGRVTLKAGIEHRLTLTAPRGDHYETFPLRDGEEFGYAPTWPQASAEFTTRGDTGWGAWQAWGRSNRFGDLQLYFNG